MSFPDFGLNEYLFGIVRIIAAVGGAVVGWFGSDPLTRLAYRLAFRAATPGPLLAVMKVGCALTLSLLIYFYLPLGGGGGFGFGPGKGGVPGKGAGQGGDKSASPTKDAKDDHKTDPAKSTRCGSAPSKSRSAISGKRFQDDGKDRYFVVDHQEPWPFQHAELDEYLETRNSLRRSK